MKRIIKVLDDFVYSLRIKRHDLSDYIFYKRLKRRLKPSVDLDLNECKACGYCCYYSVCIPTPDELDDIAKFLGYSDPLDFILEKCAFAHYHKEKLCIIYPRFLTKSKMNLAGKQLFILDFYDKKGCIFLTEDNKCQIHKVKPNEAKIQKCWEYAEEYSDPKLAWKDGEKDVLTNRYGINIQRDYECGK